MLAPRRLPGIQIDTTPPQAVQALPRMDVAVLVGFASTGPLHRPVAIEGVGQYSAVFGADAPLAWDAVRGERVTAYLGPAVRAFFANGGRRCWVIRAARCAEAEALWRGLAPTEAAALPDVATYNRFAIPGVLSIATGTNAVAAALAQARCEGSWSDGLQVSTALTQQSFAVDMLVAISPASEHFTLRTRFGLRAGDLLQFGDTRSICAYAVVDSVAAAITGGGPLEVTVRVCAAFERVSDGSAPGSPAFASPGTVDISGFAAAVPATLFAPAPEAQADAADPELELSAINPLPAAIESGHWARWQGGGDTIWLRIDEVQRSPASAGSPPVTDPSRISAKLGGPAWRELGASLPPALGGVLRAQLLTLDIRAQSDGADARLDGLGFTPRHRTPWWAQQTDAEFYAPRDDARIDGSAPLPASNASRFPLARESQNEPIAWIPLGVQPLFGTAPRALPQQATPLQRDGLARFDAELFLDPELATTGVAALITQSDAIRLMRDVPRSLFGLHAAVSIGAGGLFSEASLLAVPDAVHLGWIPRDAEEPAVGDPQTLPTPPQWTQHRGACAGPVADPMDGPDFGAFIDCATRILEAPKLTGPSAPVLPGGCRLSWSDSEPGSDYALLEATQVDFSDAREISRGKATEFDTVTRREGTYLYQVFALHGDERSDGSNVLVVQVRIADWLQLAPADLAPEFEAQWLAVQRAALHLAAATGELFAVLAMPRHFRTAEAVRYAMRLRSVREPLQTVPVDPQAFGFDEGRALSYGALYHPWLQADLGRPQLDRATGLTLSTGKRVPRVVPPDGAALGVLAGRASRRGAWIAPANEPLKDVVALAPVVASGDWQTLQDAQINLLRADPRGLMALSADTLALDADVDLRPINVRRLMILLRRLALRRGTTYVFEPNGPTLRRAVQRSFTELLTDMFRRGAFAGASPAQSFRVVTDDTINSTNDADTGRFFVELRVAPSLPLRFIAVRLAQTGDRLTVVEEL